MFELSRYSSHEYYFYEKSLDFCRSDERARKLLKLMLTVVEVNQNLVETGSKTDPDEMIVLTIGARLFNHGMVGLRSLLSGYYQTSFLLQRDILEIQFLLDLFRSNKTLIKEWQNANNKYRIEKFSPKSIRKALEEVDGLSEGRKRIYSDFSEYAGHVSYQGMKLLQDKDGVVVAGAFFDEKKLLETLFELNRRYGHAVLTLSTLISLKSIDQAKLVIKMSEGFDKELKIGFTKSDDFKELKKKLSKVKAKIH